MQIRSIATFCGSRNGNNPLYARHTVELAGYIGALRLKLIYGGGSTGLMGLMADTALAAGVDVTGVIPELLMEWEHHHKGLTQLTIVPDMHTRKRMMYERCDAAIILPGGFGTLDELFELLTWNQLRIHDKKIFLLNSAGFYDHMLNHLHQLENDGFLYDRIDDRIVVCPTPEEVYRRLA